MTIFIYLSVSLSLYPSLYPSLSLSLPHTHTRTPSVTLPLTVSISLSLILTNVTSFLLLFTAGLARIGQGSKLEKLASTGRFGLGFSSTYHLTDTPSFVSGEHLVVFDPHCSFAPGINLYQPGLRIRFKGELHFDGFEIVNVVRMRTIRIPVKLRAIRGILSF